MPNKICSLCSAPEAVRLAVEAKLGRVKYRDLQRETGFDKSILHRHYRKHMPQRAIEEHRVLNTSDCRIIMFQDGRYYHLYSQRELAPDELRPHPQDVVLEICYEPAPTPATAKNPSAFELRVLQPDEDTLPA